MYVPPSLMHRGMIGPWEIQWKKFNKACLRCQKMQESCTLTLDVAVSPPWREPNAHFSQCDASCSTQHEVLGEQLSILILGEAVTSQLQSLQRLVVGQWCGHLVQQVQVQALQWSGDDSSMQTDMVAQCDSSVNLKCAVKKSGGAMKSTLEISVCNCIYLHIQQHLNSNAAQPRSTQGAYRYQNSKLCAN